MNIAHLSDFHICHFGARMTQLQDLPLRAANGRGWETLKRQGEWTIQTRRAEGRRLQLRDRLRLVDGDGVVHHALKAGRGARGERDTQDALWGLVERRERTTPTALAKRFPTPERLDKMLSLDPVNLNLRFCAAAHAMRRDKPDWIVITGDLTDDAMGFGLILEGLAPFFEQRRVVCVPGNHDMYPSPPLWVTKEQRKTEPEKRMLWATFSSSVGLPSGGTFVRDLGSGVLLVGLDSCHRPRVLGTASGLVPLRDLHQVARELDGRGRQLRVACLHHHVVNPPLGAAGRAPLQTGMRLRNARQVFTLLKELRFKLVMNGHRHVGYRYHPARAPLFLSAPSSTIGCRSGEKPYYWSIEVTADRVGSIHSVPIPPSH